MENIANNSNDIKRISVSRNHPSAFVVGAGHFVGSFLIEKLLDKKIQVLAFDRLNRLSRDNLKEAFKYRHFYFFGLPEEGFAREALDVLEGEMPSLGYGFLFVGENTLEDDVRGFVNLAKRYGNRESGGKIKCVMVSELGLYKKNLSAREKKLKNLEAIFAKGVADNHLNGRVVRLASVYGPRMDWNQTDPMVQMIRAALLGNLGDGGISDEFSTRAIDVHSAAQLVMKSVLTGSTAMKIYDGALVHPLKVAEVREVLMNVDWSIENGFRLTKLPPWLSPNLEKTVRELNWTPESNVLEDLRDTVEYFCRNPERIENVTQKLEVQAVPEVKKQSNSKSFWSEGEVEEVVSEKVKDRWKVDSHRAGWGKKIGYFVLLLIVLYGLVYPLVLFGAGVVQIGWNMNKSKEYLAEGNYAKSSEYAYQAVLTVRGVKKGYKVIESVGRMGVLGSQINDLGVVIDDVSDGVEAIYDASEGFGVLSRVTGVISGELKDDPASIYQSANISLRSARENLTKVNMKLKSADFGSLSGLVGNRLEGLRALVLEYNLAVSKGEVASMILPGLTGVGGMDKSYLVVVQNNKNLRPSGGVIEAVARVDFSNGKLTNIDVSSSEELDGMAGPLPAPDAIRQYLNARNWSISDSSLEPDFANVGRVIETLYQRDKNKHVDGVIGVDIDAMGGLIAALRGVNTSAGEIRVWQSLDKDFFERMTDSKVYKEILSETLKKMFFLEKVNWSELGAVIDEGLTNKDIQIFVEDKSSFAYITSQNWAGVMLRQPELITGEDRDFLSVNNTVSATGSANINLKTLIRAKETIGEDLGISHKLVVGYQPQNINGTASSVKVRVRVYVPGGNKLDKVSVGVRDVLKDFKTESDYGRIVFSGVVELPVGVATDLVVDYSSGVAKFAEGSLGYRLDVIKQAGSGSSPFEWSLEFPGDWSVSKVPPRALSSKGSVSLKDSLESDLTVSVVLKKP